MGNELEYRLFYRVEYENGIIIRGQLEKVVAARTSTDTAKLDLSSPDIAFNPNRLVVSVTESELRAARKEWRQE